MLLQPNLITKPIVNVLHEFRIIKNLTEFDTTAFFLYCRFGVQKLACNDIVLTKLLLEKEFIHFFVEVHHLLFWRWVGKCS